MATLWAADAGNLMCGFLGCCSVMRPKAWPGAGSSIRSILALVDSCCEAQEGRNFEQIFAGPANSRSRKKRSLKVETRQLGVQSSLLLFCCIPVVANDARIGM